MEAWEKWWRRAVDSLEAANLLQGHGHRHSAVSRGYYAAYQAATAAATAVLLYQRLVAPTLEDREAWSHQATPILLRTTQTPFWSQNTWNSLSTRLMVLYTLRLRADYKMSAEMSEPTPANALKDAAFIVRSIGGILPSLD